MEQKIVIVLAGIAGSGKGTQAINLRKSGFSIFGAGDILRSRREIDDETGRLIAEKMDKGLGVDPNITNELMYEALTNDKNYLQCLEGYPRYPGHVDFITSRLKISLLIHLIVNEEDRGKIVERLLKRATEEGRIDDTEEAIMNRFRTYDLETVPTIQKFQELGIQVYEVNALPNEEDVWKEIELILQKKGVLIPELQ